MPAKGLVRTDYWNRVTGSVRAGDTRRDETVTDIENFLLPYSQLAGAGLHLWGVADGLSVEATADQVGVRVSAGAAIDSTGHLIVLCAGGLAVVDPNIDPDDVANIPTVPVNTSTGVDVPTDGHSGARYLTIRYLEVSSEGPLGNAPTLTHTPWLRLLETADFADAGVDVVLARLSFTADGAVTEVAADRRRLAGLPGGRVQLRRPVTAATAALTVGQTTAAELRGRSDGGLTIDVAGSPGPSLTALTVDGAGRVGIGTGEPRLPLHVEAAMHSGGIGGGLSFADRDVDSFVDTPAAGERWVWYAKAGAARLWSGADSLTVNHIGYLGVGVDPQQTQRAIHVDKSEIHSGGTVGGFSFADRTTGSFVETPDAGQRWVWYALGGAARLWSGADILSISSAGEGGGLDVSRRMRVRQGNDWSAGIWFFQSGPQNDRAFVGMSDDTHVGFWGNTGAGWGVTMDTTSGELAAVRGLTVTGIPGVFRPGVKATGNIGVWAEGGIGLYAATTGGSYAGLFTGDVRVTGTLTKANVQFEIDHPLDPANKYLRHSAIESDEFKNIYDGVALLDEHGSAEVALPDWFEALNEDYRYQLTSVGARAPDLHIADELRDGRFRIAGGPPSTKVCWLISGVRHDAYANAHPLQVEAAKSGDEAGFFMHPEEHNEPPERSLAARLPR